VEEQVQERDHKGSGYLIPPLTPAWMKFSARTTGRFEISGAKLEELLSQTLPRHFVEDNQPQNH
jgi:hypothetical protein